MVRSQYSYISWEKFIKILEVEFSLPIYKQKEFMTSVLARGQFVGKNDILNRNTNHKKKQNKIGKVDASAAALILQRYLDKF